MGTDISLNFQDLRIMLTSLPFQASVLAYDIASAFSIHELFWISIAFHNRNHSKVHIADLPYEYKYELSFVKETVIPYVLHTTSNWSRTISKRRCEIRSSITYLSESFTFTFPSEQIIDIRFFLILDCIACIMT